MLLKSRILSEPNFSLADLFIFDCAQSLNREQRVPARQPTSFCYDRGRASLQDRFSPLGDSRPTKKFREFDYGCIGIFSWQPAE